MRFCGVKLYPPQYGKDTKCLVSHGRHSSICAINYTPTHVQSCPRVISAKICSPAAANLKRLWTRSPSLPEALSAIEQRRLSIWYPSSMPVANLPTTNCYASGRKLRRRRMRPSRRTLPRTAWGRREEMEHIPTCDR